MFLYKRTEAVQSHHFYRCLFLPVKTRLYRFRFSLNTLRSQILGFISNFSLAEPLPPSPPTMMSQSQNQNQNQNRSSFWPATSMTDLNADSLAHCASYLSLQDVSNMAMTCKYLQKVAYSDSIWHRFFRSFSSSQFPLHVFNR